MLACCTPTQSIFFLFLPKQGKFAKRNVFAGVSHHKGTTNLHKKSRLMILMIHIVSAVISVKANEAMLLIYYVVSRETMELAVD